MHQYHYGKKFYLDKKKGYWISTTSPRVRAHVWVWKYHNGDIPADHHVHHIDHDKSNNDINNLTIMLRKNHLSYHNSLEENRKRAAEHCEKIRHLTKKWHRSEEGKRWHTQHGHDVWKKRKPFQKICCECNTQYTTKTFHQLFCSNSCKSKNRRRLKLDFIERTCLNCKKIFNVNKYSKSKTCGRKCGNIFKTKIN